jgi:hypothetical protein
MYDRNKEARTTGAGEIQVCALSRKCTKKRKAARMLGTTSKTWEIRIEQRKKERKDPPAP